MYDKSFHSSIGPLINPPDCCTYSCSLIQISALGGFPFAASAYLETTSATTAAADQTARVASQSTYKEDRKEEAQSPEAAGTMMGRRRWWNPTGCRQGPASTSKGADSGHAILRPNTNAFGTGEGPPFQARCSPTQRRLNAGNSTSSGEHHSVGWRALVETSTFS